MRKPKLHRWLLAVPGAILTFWQPIYKAINAASNADWVMSHATSFSLVASKVWAWAVWAISSAGNTILIVVGLAWIAGALLLPERRHAVPEPISPTPANEDREELENARRELARLAQAERQTRDALDTTRAELERLRPPVMTPFFTLGFCWGIAPPFFNAYRNVINPSPQTLNDLILGPFCPACSSSLRVESPHTSWMPAGEPPVYAIANPCPCGREGPDELKQPDVSFFDIQEDVWREAQRLVRRGESLPPGPCHHL